MRWMGGVEGARHPCNIWALMHSTVMEHNSLRPLGTAYENRQEERGKMYGRE